jgi:hypothetical protein
LATMSRSFVSWYPAPGVPGDASWLRLIQKRYVAGWAWVKRLRLSPSCGSGSQFVTRMAVLSAF